MRSKLLLALVGIVAIVIAVWRFHYAARADAQHSDRAAAPAQAEPNKGALSLQAQTRLTESGAIIRLQWDPSAAAVRRSSYATLFVYDGATPNKVVLNRRVLDSGYMDYSPANNQITFHLIFEKGRTEGEFLLVLLGARAAQSGSVSSPNVKRGL